jgi:alpha-L-fucosidase
MEIYDSKMRIVAIILCFTCLASSAQTFEETGSILRQHVLNEATWALQQQPVTVTAQSSPRSAGGRHDFYSEGDYWWPNPASADSPYIQKDGMTNPDNFVAHRHAMIRLSKITGALASAYLLTKDDKYVRHALAHCKAWFVDTSTLMNPHMLYAQAIKGRATGRGIGIIDAIQLMEVTQGLLAMESSKAMDKVVLAGTKKWFEQFLEWLTTHQYGRDEMNAENNHGTCWVMQVAAFAKFTGNKELLKFCSDRYKNVLLPNQMEKDGSFPRELRRTKPYGYSIFNLDAMATICQVLSSSEDNLWEYQTADGKNIRKGIEFLYPFIADKSKWPYKQDVMYWNDWPVAQPFLVFGATAYNNREWFATWKQLDHSPTVEEVIRNLPVRNPLIWIDNTPRDQQAIDEAINGWWTASMKTQDQRIQWWKDAKFGMFIHWGVYSLPGGEWKGNKVSGYAEHLMRKEKITRKDYLELAHQFNPIQFNAEEWILHAKKAGMRYFVITSKHHDGFAMYNSSVSDFDIIDQTSFKRDPMAELAAAAKKHGVKFGFYYSHAFDWEHPDAPGNDWEYNNPGGDKMLFGGRNWFDVHPELLPKAKKYVDEKAIPQIKELLLKYHPDIMWFDTPGKLPLSENIRILKAIREVDQNVVVNGRLARNPAISFGDYRNTADRPAEFYPVNEAWEAIPTTNESYGYHKYDSSHKPVAHFVQLLASAVSRGGNLLMNIGPRGDGLFDERDLTILNGIGAWIDKNGESIYGASAGPLPLQNWGVSTLKGNKIYLHVFHWPADGKLYVGGLTSQISKAFLLIDPSKNISIQHLPSGDLCLLVPQVAPDTMNTVIVMEYRGKLQADSVRFVSPGREINRLLAYDATQKGKELGYGDGKTDRYYVDGWESNEQGLSWEFRVIKKASYRIILKYLAPEESAGGIYTFNIDQSSGKRSKRIYHVRDMVFTRPKATTVVTYHAGIVILSPGTYKLSITPEQIRKTELMKILEFQLIPSDND